MGRIFRDNDLSLHMYVVSVNKSIMKKPLWVMTKLLDTILQRTWNRQRPTVTRSGPLVGAEWVALAPARLCQDSRGKMWSGEAPSYLPKVVE
jgi:hypothetical protein